VLGKITNIRSTNLTVENSRIRQPIEALFSWFGERTMIQKASKVRAEKRLIVHIFGKLAACLILLNGL
jgi:hypothetical protein